MLGKSWSSRDNPRPLSSACPVQPVGLMDHQPSWLVLLQNEPPPPHPQHSVRKPKKSKLNLVAAGDPIITATNSCSPFAQAGFKLRTVILLTSAS
jgi:hypothetical protein